MIDPNVSSNASSCTESSNSTERCFPEVFENSPSKIILTTLSIIFCLFNLYLTLGIIWYERFSSDNRRTLMNRLVSLICLELAKWLVLCQSVDIIRYIVGPFSVTFCNLHNILKLAARIQLLLLFNCMQITKYVFVFYLRNPSAVTEEFWSLSICICSSSLSIISSFVIVYLNEQQTIGFYLCSDSDIKNHLNFSRINFRYLDYFSLILFAFVHIKLKLYKRKIQPAPVNNYSPPSFSLSNIYSNAITLVCFILMQLSSRAVNSLDHITINQYPNTLYMQTYSLMTPNLIMSILCIVYYVQNPKIHEFVHQKLKETIQNSNVISLHE